jgi:4a-hydroxytetrahydrobiopterin dehydratase
MRKLSDAEIKQELSTLPGWEQQGDMIARVFDRRTFHGSIAFVNTIAEIADRADHHPDIDIRYSRVRIALTTHDANGLTDKDVALARQITAAAD